MTLGFRVRKFKCLHFVMHVRFVASAASEKTDNIRFQTDVMYGLYLTEMKTETWADISV
jgi:hypothetical protein